MTSSDWPPADHDGAAQAPPLLDQHARAPANSGPSGFSKVTEPPDGNPVSEPRVKPDASREASRTTDAIAGGRSSLPGPTPPGARRRGKRIRARAKPASNGRPALLLEKTFARVDTMIDELAKIRLRAGANTFIEGKLAPGYPFFLLMKDKDIGKDVIKYVQEKLFNSTTSSYRCHLPHLLAIYAMAGQDLEEDRSYYREWAAPYLCAYKDSITAKGFVTWIKDNGIRKCRERVALGRDEGRKKRKMESEECRALSRSFGRKVTLSVALDGYASRQQKPKGKVDLSRLDEASLNALATLMSALSDPASGRAALLKLVDVVYPPPVMAAPPLAPEPPAGDAAVPIGPGKKLGGAG
jgi:hypothetical protein